MSSMISHTASELAWMQACRAAGGSRKSMKANSDRRKPSSTRRALASLGVHPCRLAMRLRRFPLSVGRRILTTIEGAGFTKVSSPCHSCKHCSAGSLKTMLFFREVQAISSTRPSHPGIVEILHRSSRREEVKIAQGETLGERSVEKFPPPEPESRV